MINLTESNGDQIVLSDDGSRGTRNGIPLTPTEARAEYDSYVTSMAGGVGGSVALMVASVIGSLWLGKFVAKRSRSQFAGLSAAVLAYYVIGPEISIGDVKIPPYKDEVKQALGFKKKLPALWNQAYWKGAQ